MGKFSCAKNAFMLLRENEHWVFRNKRDGTISEFVQNSPIHTLSSMVVSGYSWTSCMVTGFTQSKHPNSIKLHGFLLLSLRSHLMLYSISQSSHKLTQIKSKGTLPFNERCINNGRRTYFNTTTFDFLVCF